MISAEDVAIVIPTRGNVDLSSVFTPLYQHHFAMSYIWNNAGEPEGDLSVYGRYAAIEKTTAPVILTQDDDVALTQEAIDALLAAYEPGVLTANMPQRFRRDWYTDHCLVGFGAIFDRDLPEHAFERYVACVGAESSSFVAAFDSARRRGAVLSPEALDLAGLGRFFYRTCDVVFTALTPRKLIDAPVQILDYAYGSDRMFKQLEFSQERERMLELALKVKAKA